MEENTAGTYVRITNEELAGLKWIFFDVGTVLADEEPVHRERFRMIQPELKRLTGRDMTYEEFDRVMDEGGMLCRGAFGYAARRLGVKNIPPYLCEFEVPVPGAPEGVKLLAGRFRLGIIANQRSGLRERLDRLGYAGCFVPEAVFGSDDCGMAKPDPRIFAAALAAAGCRPEEAMMVGDRPDNDIGPARRAGMYAARIVTGSYRNNPPSTPDEEADICVPSVAVLADILLPE
ncbi:MAG: HAD family hydrolase [Clostridia bacterium]|nr:HAD family hydrolase [Clostridia bacterium]